MHFDTLLYLRGKVEICVCCVSKPKCVHSVAEAIFTWCGTSGCHQVCWTERLGSNLHVRSKD